MRDPTGREPEQEQESRGYRRPAAEAFARFATLVVTNAAKLLGLYIGAHEALQRGHPAQNGVLMLAALFFFGVQAGENVLLRTIDRLFGGVHGEE